MNSIYYLFEMLDKLHMNNENKYRFIKLFINKYNFFHLINLNNKQINSKNY